MSSSRDPLRLARGSVAATVATAVALLGHVVGGGAVPAWAGLLVPWWLSVAVCTVLAGTRFSLPRMAGAVMASQTLFHGLFMAGTPGDPSVRLVAPPGDHLDHSAHLGMTTAATAAGGHDSAHGAAQGAAHGAADAAQHAVHAGHGDLSMLLGHVLAAVLTTVLLHRGEALVLGGLALAQGLMDALLRPLAAAPPLPLVGRRGMGHVPMVEDRRRRQRAVLTPQLRRGPPLVRVA